MCFASHLNLSGNTLNFPEIRKKLNLVGGISFKDVPKVADYFDCDFILLNEKQEIIQQRNLQNKPALHIMLMKEHY